MARPSSQIKVGDVAKFIDGPIGPIGCTEKKYTGCNDIYKCAFRGIWQKVAKATSDIIDKITFEDLAGQVSKQKDAVSYQI